MTELNELSTYIAEAERLRAALHKANETIAKQQRTISELRRLKGVKEQESGTWLMTATS